MKRTAASARMVAITRDSANVWIDSALDDFAHVIPAHLRSRARHAMFHEALALARNAGRKIIAESDVASAADAVALTISETGDV